MNLNCRLLALNLYKAYLKNKSRSGKTLSASFSTKFLKTKKILLNSITWLLTIINCLVAFNSFDIEQYTVSQGKVPGIFGCFSDPSFQVVYPCIIRWPNLFSFFFRSLFSFLHELFTPLMTPKGKKRIRGALQVV